MTWLYALVAPIAFVLLAYRFGRKPFYAHLDWKLAEAQYEHARWIAICLEFTKEGCDDEAKIAAEQVVVLRSEINFYRRMLVRLQRAHTEKV